MYVRLKGKYPSTNGTSRNSDSVNGFLGVLNRIIGSNLAPDVGTSYGAFDCEAVSGTLPTVGMYNVVTNSTSDTSPFIQINKKHSQMNAYSSLYITPHTGGNGGLSLVPGLASGLSSIFTHGPSGNTWSNSNGPLATINSASVCSTYNPYQVDIHITDTSFSIWVQEEWSTVRNTLFMAYTDLEYIASVDDVYKVANLYYCPGVTVSYSTIGNATTANIASSGYYGSWRPQAFNYHDNGFTNVKSQGNNYVSLETDAYTREPVIPFEYTGVSSVPTGDGFYEHLLLPLIYGGGTKTVTPRRMLGVARTSNDTFTAGETILNGTDSWVVAPKAYKTLYPESLVTTTVSGTNTSYVSHATWAFKQQ